MRFDIPVVGLKTLKMMKKAGANIKSLKEPWLDTTTPQGRLLFTIFSGVSQFERELIRERTMEGLASARARGRMGGRPGKDKKTINQALTLYDSKAYSIPIGLCRQRNRRNQQQQLK